ncbi:MAG: hypothetical protein AAGI68_00510 [Planctomycetota bacterium]
MQACAPRHSVIASYDNKCEEINDTLAEYLTRQAKNMMIEGELREALITIQFARRICESYEPAMLLEKSIEKRISITDDYTEQRF